MTDTASSELDREHRQVAGSVSRAQTGTPLEGHPGRCEPEHGVREGTGPGEPDSRDTRPNRATRFIETTRGILSYSEIAPWLAEKVTRLEAAVYSETYAGRSPDSELILEFHRSICGDLVPEWAGRWRDVGVSVGKLQCPPPNQVPLLMKDYELDLQARWPEAAANISDLTVELLAFAEGRFLTIHPFRDFNGRIIRVFLLELLRRLDLPRVELAPQAEEACAGYFTALEAADRLDWRPLVNIWKNRFTASA